MTNVPQGSPPPRPGRPMTGPARRRQARPQSLDELHGSLDAAWAAVNEVARLVDEIHRARGHGRLR